MGTAAVWMRSLYHRFVAGRRSRVPRCGSEVVEDGKVGFQEGQFHVTDPRGGGLPAVVIPGDDVLLTVDGRPADGPVPVSSGSRLSVRPRLSAGPVRGYHVRVAPDRMTAYLVTERLGPPGYRVRDASPAHVIRLSAEALPGVQAVPTVEAVERSLRSAGVAAGIDRAAIRRTLESPQAREVPVARGRAAEPGSPGRVDLKAVGPALDDPFGLSLRIKAGELLAQLVGPCEGVPGYDVSGNVVPPTAAERHQLVAGFGAMLTPGGTEAIATIPGRPVLTEASPCVCRASVVPLVRVAGPLVQGTAPFRFGGDVRVDGDVDGGVVLQAGGWIWVRGSVSGATLEAGQGIRVDGDVQWGRLITRATRRRLIPSQEQCGLVLAELSQLREYANLLVGHPRYTELSRSRPFGTILLQLAGQQLDSLIRQIRSARRTLSELAFLRTQLDLDAVLSALEQQLRAGSMTGADDLTQYIEAVAAAAERAVDILGAGGHAAPVHAGALLGSEVDAEGGVTLHGSGAEQSVIRARGRVRAAILRDVQVAASAAIDVDTVIASTPDSVLLEVSPGGRIRVGEARGAAWLKVGEWTHVLDPDTWSVLVRSDPGGRVSVSSGRIHMEGPIPVLRFLESHSEGVRDAG